MSDMTRAEAIRILEEVKMLDDSIYQYNPLYLEALDIAINSLQIDEQYDLMYEQVEPKTGHWRHYEGMLICSECGTEFYYDIMEYCGDDVPKWCPNCGCRMVEPQESEG